ncbi:MAG: uracil-DNA glycosylase [Clostridia bacterium]|nr:uracil-DNA glycosylase [Clostridia bacterium]MBN2882361.1 uracil-DNA glycosylase [Clostridia bacterium]
MGKIKGELTRLYEEYSTVFKGMELVYGDGNHRSGIVMIGEAPGKDEVRLGKPFVGVAGGNLGKFMKYLGLSRDDIYVTNAIKYRLFKMSAASGRKSNRPALKKEVLSSRPFLMKELEIMGAKLVITLGNVPLRAVTGNFSYIIGAVHGEPIETDNYIVMPLYHPASLIYNRSLETEYYKDLDKLKKLIVEV